MPIRTVRKGEPISWPAPGGQATRPAPEAGLLIYDADPSGDRKPPVLITNSQLAAEGYAPLRSLPETKRRKR